MTVQAVLAPLFVQVALTFVLMLWMGYVRVTAVRRREVHQRDIALREPNWPKPIAQVANAYQNQLELPILFYVLVILAWVTRQADTLFVVMAWLFVLTRLVHAWVHITTNRMSHRFFIFIIGAVILLLMWIIFAARILLAL